MRLHSSSFGLAKSIEFARALGRLPETVIVYGIEGEDFSLGNGLTEKVEKAAEEVFRQILKQTSNAVK